MQITNNLNIVKSQSSRQPYNRKQADNTVPETKTDFSHNNSISFTGNDLALRLLSKFCPKGKQPYKFKITNFIDHSYPVMTIDIKKILSKNPVIIEIPSNNTVIKTKEFIDV